MSEPHVFEASALNSLSALFAPRSVAVVGASQNSRKIGGIPLDYLLRFGYGGQVFAVNPGAQSVQGLSAHASLTAIGQAVDLAIVAVPGVQVAQVLEDAIAARVQSLVVFSAGFAEVGPDGAAQQQALAARARQGGVRLIGPNCLGLMRPASGLYATFSPAVGAGQAPAGNIGLVSQSGAFGAYAYCMARSRGMGLSLWATTGNEADVQVADVLAWLAGDEQTRVIMAYLEGCRDGPRLRAALALARAHGKPVVLCKVGTSALGAEAAASHTASLAGNDAVYEAVFRQHGVLRAHTVDDFFALAASASVACRAGCLPKNRRLGVLTVSGGVGALVADAASQAALELPPMPETAQGQIRQWVPFAAPRNPVDITGQVANDASLLDKTAHLMLEQGLYGGWLGFFAAAGLSDAFHETLCTLMQTLRQQHPDTLLASCTLHTPQLRAALEAMGCLVFDDPSTAVRCMAALAQWREGREGREGGEGGAGLPAAVAAAGPGAAPARPGLCAGTHSEAQSLALLQAAGVPVVEHMLVADADQAAAAVSRLGGKMVLKVASADIAHKSDCGGVALHLDTPEAARAAFARVMASARAAYPRARIDGALAARMVSGGVECIAGVHRDAVFGPVLMVGLGGIHAEIFQDVALRVLPLPGEAAFSRQEAHAMLRELQSFALLAGARGAAPADLESLVDALCALARFAAQAGETLESAEINPLLARPLQDGGCVALDGLVLGQAVENA